MTDAEKVRILEEALMRIYMETAAGQGAVGYGRAAEAVAERALRKTGAIR